MVVKDFTKPELDFYMANCNFVGNEIRVFEMRSQGDSLEEIAEALNMSVEGIKQISRKVNRKITTVLGFMKGAGL